MGANGFDAEARGFGDRAEFPLELEGNGEFAEEAELLGAWPA